MAFRSMRKNRTTTRRPGSCSATARRKTSWTCCSPNAATLACRPGLVALTFGRADAAAWRELAGVSAMVAARCGGQTFREKMLFTHRGLSGPAILQASSYWKCKNDEPLTLDLAPDAEWTTALKDGAGRRDAAAARTALRKVLPQRLADRWLELAAKRGRAADWTNAGLEAMEESLHHWQVKPSGTEGYEKAEVTAGGVGTTELSSKTMESRKVPGLYFIGEVVDVTGWLGGFKFQWAWASGAVAGRAVGEGRCPCLRRQAGCGREACPVKVIPPPRLFLRK